MKVVWQDGVSDPNKDKEFVRPPGISDDLKLPRKFGQIFVGTKGAIYFSDAYCGSRPKLFPETLMDEARKVEQVYPRVKGGPTQELCRAIRGEGDKPVSNFEDHAGPLTELVLVGNLAVRLKKKIDWNATKLEATNAPEAAQYISRVYRKGWEPELG